MNNKSLDKYNNYLDGIDIIYYINLDRAKDRKKHMTKFFEDPVFYGKKILRFNAIDHAKVNVYKKIQTNSVANINRVTKPEYACLLSHLEVIRKFSKTNYDHALIFEDDLDFVNKNFWNEPIKDIIQNAPKDYDIIKVYRHCNNAFMYNKLYTLWDIKKENTNRLKGDWGMVAYIISNKAAKKLMNRIYIHNKYVLNDNSLHVADYLIYKELKTYIYKYPFFNVINNYKNVLQSYRDIYKKQNKTKKKSQQKYFNKNKTCKYINYKKFK